MLGLFGYDLGRQIETLPVQAERDIDLPDMAVGLYDWALVADHHRKTLTLIVHHSLQTRLDWLANPPVNAPKADFKLTDAWQSNMSRSAYGEKFRKIQDYLLAGIVIRLIWHSVFLQLTKAMNGRRFYSYPQEIKRPSLPFYACQRIP